MGEIQGNHLHRSSASTGQEVAFTSLQHLLDRCKTHDRDACVKACAKPVRRDQAPRHFIFAGDPSNTRVLPSNTNPEFVVDNNRPSPFEH